MLRALSLSLIEMQEVQQLDIREVENLLIRLAKVSSDMTKSTNFSGTVTKKQTNEERIVIKKSAKKLNLDAEYLKANINI